MSTRTEKIEHELVQNMHLAATEHDFEAATVYRNRLEAVRALIERQRIASAAMGALDVVAVAVCGTIANAQVFQVRDGAVVARRSLFLRNPDGCGEAEVLEAFLLQYYDGADVAIPPRVVVSRTALPLPALSEALARRRGAHVEVQVAERGEKRRISEAALRTALQALDRSRLKEEWRIGRRAEGLAGLKQHLAMASLPTRIECFDISNLGPMDTVASMVVFGDGAPRKDHYRHFKIRKAQQDDYASMREVLSRRVSRYRATRDKSRHAKSYDESFASLPSLIVIDGGVGQLSVSLPILAEFRELGSTVISLAKRIEEVFIPDRPLPLLLPYESAPLQLLQQMRDEAHRFAIEFHRRHREDHLTRSFLDDIPRIGDARKQAILAYFGTPERILTAGQKDIEAVPGLQPKVARDLYEHIRNLDSSVLANTGSVPTEYNVT